MNSQKYRYKVLHPNMCIHLYVNILFDSCDGTCAAAVLMCFFFARFNPDNMTSLGNTVGKIQLLYFFWFLFVFFTFFFILFHIAENKDTINTL